MIPGYDGQIEDFLLLPVQGLQDGERAWEGGQQGENVLTPFKLRFSKVFKQFIIKLVRIIRD